MHFLAKNILQQAHISSDAGPPGKVPASCNVAHYSVDLFSN
jgi:hypothetical protein